MDLNDILVIPVIRGEKKSSVSLVSARICYIPVIHREYISGIYMDLNDILVIPVIRGE